LLGSVATKKLLGVNSVQEVRGRVIEHNNRKYLAGYHPAASFYREDMVENIRQDFALLRQELQKLVLRPGPYRLPSRVGVKAVNTAQGPCAGKALLHLLKQR